MDREIIEAGIAGMGFYYPKKTINTRAIADEMDMSEITYKHIGVNQIFVPDEEEQSSYMALEACKNALVDVGITGNVWI